MGTLPSGTRSAATLSSPQTTVLNLNCCLNLNLRFRVMSTSAGG
jgi:hypothetical protein